MSNHYRGYRILIVDDNPGDFSAIKGVVEDVTEVTPLHARGISDTLDILETFATAPEPAEIDPKDGLCVVIIDQDLSLASDENAQYPEIDPREAGLFLIRHVHERCPWASVGIMTGYANTSQEKKFRAAKLAADFYWDKAAAPPSFGDDLRRQIDRVIAAVKKHNRGVGKWA